MAARTHFYNNALQNYSYLQNQYFPVGWHTGNVWWVCSVTGTDSAPPGNGNTPEIPFASIGYAISQATASNDDVIYVMPGHVETITGAAGVNVNKAGLCIEGLGTGRGRPQITFTTSNAASFDINSANCLISNMYFTLDAVSGLTAGINVKAADCWIRDCEFEIANGSNQATQAILTTSSANRLRVEKCQFHGNTTGSTGAAITLVGGSDIIIADNVMQSFFGAGVGGIQNITTTVTNLSILRNQIQNFTASSTKAMTFTSSTTGQISQNWMQILSGSAPITGAAMSWVGGNYYAAAVATAGTLI